MSPEKLLELIISGIAAASKFAWPVLVFLVVLLFLGEIRALLRRIHKGNLLGQEFEFYPEAKEFQKVTELAGKEATPQIEPAVSDAVSIREKVIVVVRPAVEEPILELAKSNPEMAMISLSNLVEREVQLLLGYLGLLPAETRMHPIQATGLLTSKGYLPKNTLTSLAKFWELRNKVVHSPVPIDRREVLGVIDTGLLLLRTLQAIPHEVNRVYKSDYPLFEDPICQQERKGVVGLILDTQSPGVKETTKRIYPTTRIGYYRESKIVTWEWNLDRHWGRTWYLDPDTMKPREAWSRSLEFVGRHIDEL